MNNILMNEQEFLWKCVETLNISGGPKDLEQLISDTIDKYINKLNECGELTPTHNDMLVLTHCFNLITIGVDNGILEYTRELEKTHDNIFSMLMTNKLGYDLFGKHCVPVLKGTLESGDKSGE